MSRVLFDIEGDALLNKVKNIWCIVAHDLDSGETRRWDPSGINEAIEYLRSAQMLAGHNIIGYDLPTIWKLVGEWDTVPLITDTLVVSRFLWPERPGGHGLGPWGERLGFPKIEFHEFDKYVPEMLTYCERDVDLNAKVFEKLEEEHGERFEGWSVYPAGSRT